MTDVAKVVATAATVATGGASLFSGAPLALLVALGVSVVAGAGGTLWYKSQLNSLEADVAKQEAVRQAQVVASDARDNALIRLLSEQLAPIVQGFNRQNQNVQIALGKVKADPNCGVTPAARAFDGIVLNPASKPDPTR